MHPACFKGNRLLKQAHFSLTEFQRNLAADQFPLFPVLRADKQAQVVPYAQYLCPVIIFPFTDKGYDGNLPACQNRTGGVLIPDVLAR